MRRGLQQVFADCPGPVLEAELDHLSLRDRQRGEVLMRIDALASSAYQHLEGHLPAAASTGCRCS